jgi:hypothetical protein
MKYFKFPSTEKGTWDALNDQGNGSRLVDYLYNPVTDEFAAEIPEPHVKSIKERAGNLASLIENNLTNTLSGFADPSIDPSTVSGNGMGEWTRYEHQ